MVGNERGDAGLRRRTVLRAVAAAGATAVAGCTGGDTGDRSATDPSTSPDPTSTATASPTATPEPARFELVGVDAPATVEIGTEVEYGFTVRNIGETNGTFDTTVEMRIDRSASDWQSSNTIEREIPPGESATITTADLTGQEILMFLPPYDCTATYIHLISDFGKEYAIEAVPRHLTFGEAHRTPEGIDLSVEGVDLQSAYTYVDDDGTEREVAAPDGKQWAFARVAAENARYEPAPAPTPATFAVLVGDDGYGPADVRKEEGRYDGGDLESDAVRRGWVAFAVPASVDPADLRVRWRGKCTFGDAVAFWRSG